MSNYTRTDPVELFFRHVDKTDNCWLWVGAKTKNGYGKLGRDLKTISAHRYSFEIHNGAIPDGMLVCHQCDVRSCVNPHHLFLGTHKDNYIDCVNKGRFVTNTAAFNIRNKNRTECKNGHKWEKENIYISPKGHRSCRSCTAVSEEKRKLRRRAQNAKIFRI